MSGVVEIRAALETALAAMSPALDTAFENVDFEPGVGTPYQAVHILFAQPDNSEFGSRHQENGYMQVTLKYPTSAGTLAIAARAELIRTAFLRGNSFASGGVTVLITHTPEIMAGTVDGVYFTMPVKIRFNVQLS